MNEETQEERFTREEGMSPKPERRIERREAERREVSPHQEYLELRLTRFFAKCLAIFAVLGVTNAVALLGFGIVLGKQSDLTHTIQKQRYDSLLTSCAETNQRNHDVNARIDDAIAQLPPKGRKSAEKKAKPFRLIISAAVPLKPDCAKYATDRVIGEG